MSDRVCPGCGKPLPPDSRPHKKYCNNACKMRYYRRENPEKYPKYRKQRANPGAPPPPRFVPAPSSKTKLPDNLGDLTSKEIIMLDLPASVIVALLKRALEREEAERVTRNRSREKAKEEQLALDPETAREVARILARKRYPPRTGAS